MNIGVFMGNVFCEEQLNEGRIQRGASAGAHRLRRYGLNPCRTRVYEISTRARTYRDKTKGESSLFLFIGVDTRNDRICAARHGGSPLLLSVKEKVSRVENRSAYECCKSTVIIES